MGMGRGGFHTPERAQCDPCEGSYGGQLGRVPLLETCDRLKIFPPGAQKALSAGSHVNTFSRPRSCPVHHAPAKWRPVSLLCMDYKNHSFKVFTFKTPSSLCTLTHIAINGRARGITMFFIFSAVFFFSFASSLSFIVRPKYS